MKLSKISFWALSLTWGLIMTLIGLITTLFLMCCGYRPKRNVYGWYTEIGSNFGGLDLGPFCIVNTNPSRHLLNHEFGHAIQNCYLGPLFPFIVAIPSATRYWYREIVVRTGRKKAAELPSYDAIWFEGGATKLGNEYYNKTKGEL